MYKSKKQVESIDSFEVTLFNNMAYPDIAETISKTLHRPVIIEDKFFRRIGKFSISDTFKDLDDWDWPKHHMKDPQLKKLVYNVHKKFLPTAMPPHPQYGVRQARMIYPITADGTLYGFLHIFDKNSPPLFSKDEHQIISNMVKALSIKALKDDAVSAAEERMLGQLYRRFFFQEYKGERVIKDIAVFLELDFSVPFWLLLSQIEGFVSNTETIKTLKCVFAENDINARVINCDKDGFLIFLPEERKSYINSSIVTLAYLIVEQLKGHCPDAACYIGIGRKCETIWDQYKSYNEAKTALDYLTEAKLSDNVLSFESLGIIGVISLSEDVRHMISFSERILNPLVEYDNEHPYANLVQTLKEFMNNDCSIKNTASAMFVHVNTMRRRIEKIQEVGQFSFDDVDVKFELHLACRILALMQTLKHN